MGILIKFVLTNIVPRLQEEVDVVVQQPLVGLVVMAKPLEKHVSMFHYVLHPMVVWLPMCECECVHECVCVCVRERNRNIF